MAAEGPSIAAIQSSQQASQGGGGGGGTKTSVGFGAIQTGGNLAQAITGGGPQGGIFAAMGNPLAIKSAGAGSGLVNFNKLLGEVFSQKGEGGPTMGANSPYQTFASAGGDFGGAASGGHNVPMSSLGNMHPSPTPGMGGRSQDVGMGM